MSKLTTIALLGSTALIVALGVFSFEQAKERARLANDVAQWKRLSSQVIQDLERERARVREINEELRAAQERVAAQPANASAPTPPPGAPVNPAPLPPPVAAPATAAMINYLGDPVAPPANLDSMYSPDSVLATFKGFCEARGIKIQSLAIDATEFPYVLHGRVADAREFFGQIKTELGTLPGYAYSGSVTGGTRDGSTYFSLNMTPPRAYPREQSESIQRRLMLRMQMLAAAWTDL